MVDQKYLAGQSDSTSQPPQDLFGGKDPLLLLFLVGIVSYKLRAELNYDEVKIEKEVEREVERLYDLLQRKLVELALQNLPPEKQGELNGLIQKGATNEEIQKYLLDNIPNFMKKMEDYMLQFQYDYLGPDLASRANLTPPNNPNKEA